MSDKHFSTKEIALCGLLIAAALVMHYLENLLPPLVVGIPVKPGLANIFTLYALIECSRGEAFFVTLVRCTLGALIGGSVTSLLYSVCGGMLSYLAMLLLYKMYVLEKISPVGLSIAGAFMFNVGQLLVGVLINGTAMLLYFPAMSLLSIPTGLFVGLCCRAVLAAKKHA